MEAGTFSDPKCYCCNRGVRVEERTGAIRMVAFGVLELPLEIPQAPGKRPTQEVIDRENKLQEIMDLVEAEVKVMGWLLKKALTRSARSYGQLILMGPLGGSQALLVRPMIGQGSLQEVCLAAVEYLETGRTNYVP